MVWGFCLVGVLGHLFGWLVFLSIIFNSVILNVFICLKRKRDSWDKVFITTFLNSSGSCHRDLVFALESGADLSFSNEKLHNGQIVHQYNSEQYKLLRNQSLLLEVPDQVKPQCSKRCLVLECLLQYRNFSIETVDPNFSIIDCKSFPKCSSEINNLW